MRIGQGFDVHPLAPGRRLVLGGVEIDHPLGLAGHSDADVLSHALGDALLGGAGLGDLGRYFPDSDPDLKGVSSLKLLGRIAAMVREKGLSLVNADLTLLAERPRIAPHAELMRERLSEALGTDPDRILVKATTTEGLGLVGREEGMAALAVVLLAEEEDLRRP